jgi:hypothetical protein
MTEPTDDERELTEDVLEEWDKVIGPLWERVIRPFIEGPRTSTPDIKVLAQVLRSTAPLPEDFRNILAELLDNHNRLPYLACNWQLRPVFTGGHDKELDRVEEEGQINDAIGQKPTVTEAIKDVAEAIGLSEETVWKKKRKMEERLASWEKLLIEVSPFTDEQRAEVLRTLRANWL